MLNAFLEKPLEEITYEDLLELITALAAEGDEEQTRLELKESIPKGKDLATTVAAMANTDGGRILIGITDRKKAEGGDPGEASGRVIGVTGNPDQLKQRVGNAIRDSVEPALHPFPELQAISVPDTDRYVIVVDVAQSFHLPHQVLGRGFYRRVATGNDLLRTDMLRGLFQHQGQLQRQVRTWVRERIELVERGEGPVPALRRNAPGEAHERVRLYLHLVSLPFFESGRVLRLTQEAWRKVDQLPLFSSSHSGHTRFNADGLIAHDGGAQNTLETARAYTQLMRTGIVEAASKRVAESDAGKLFISLEYLDHMLLEKIPRLLWSLDALGVPGPYHLSLHLRHAGGASFIGQARFAHHREPIPSNDLAFEAFIAPDAARYIVEPVPNSGDSPSQSRTRLRQTLRPFFDHLWQAAGFSEAPETGG